MKIKVAVGADPKKYDNQDVYPGWIVEVAAAENIRTVRLVSLAFSTKKEAQKAINALSGLIDCYTFF